MANLTRLYDFVAGTLIKSAEVDAEFNQIIDRLAGNIVNENIGSTAAIALSKLAITPMVRAFHSANQAVSTSGTVLALNSEQIDTGVAAGFSAMHDTVTNNSRLVAPVTGVYALYFNCEYGPNAEGDDVQFAIRQNGTTVLVAERVQTAAAAAHRQPPLYTEHTLTATDYIELVATAFGGAGTMLSGCVLGMSFVSRAS